MALNEFFDGAFRIAVETKAPILPMTIINMDRICDGNKLDLGPGVLHIRFDEPIPTAPLTSANVPELKKQVWNLLHDRFTAGL